MPFRSADFQSALRQIYHLLGIRGRVRLWPTLLRCIKTCPGGRLFHNFREYESDIQSGFSRRAFRAGGDVDLVVLHERSG